MAETDDDRPPGPGPRHVVTLVVTERELIDLARLLSDEDAEGALHFLQDHLKGKMRRLLEGG